jgi:hypothetical protein
MELQAHDWWVGELVDFVLAFLAHDRTDKLRLMLHKANKNSARVSVPEGDKRERISLKQSNDEFAN